MVVSRIVPSIVLCGLIWGCANDPGASPAHVMRQDMSGSMSIAPAIAMGSFPFRSEYSQLSESDRLRLRSYFPRMAAGDEPPYPMGGLKSIYGPMAEGAQRIFIRGEVYISVHVDASGRAKQVAVLKASDPDLGQYVSAVSMFVNYKPAMCSGVPCESDFPVRVEFR